MAQKVQFIAAIVAKPRLLVLDEPFTGLDPVNMDVLRNAVRSARQGGTTVIFSTHDMDMAERLCDTLFMIYRGKKVLDGTLAAIQAQFGDDTIRLRTTDADSSLADLPGVTHVNDQRHYKELRIGRDADPRAILQELLKRTTVEHFELARPSLHDIFVRIAGPEARPADEVQHA
jgi:ABC-2 type transport system ATP-binding protein